VAHVKFNLAKLEKLNDPARFESLPPEVLWEALGAPSGACAVIEIGAGTGLFAAAFVALAPEAVIYAADTEDAMLEWMRLNRPEVARRRIAPVKAGESSVPLDDEIADAVYMINLHHELARPAESYAEAFRLLEPGGRVLVVDWARKETPKGPPLQTRAAAEAIAALLAEARFIDIQVDETTLPWHFMAMAAKPRL
jgi:ubiquinone/menaquinone biosynthesis C-methylase UbiE